MHIYCSTRFFEKFWTNVKYKKLFCISQWEVLLLQSHISLIKLFCEGDSWNL
jgi:hypothetical protein